MLFAPRVIGIVFATALVAGVLLLFLNLRKPPHEPGTARTELPTDATQPLVAKSPQASRSAEGSPRALPSALEIARWKDSLDRAEEEIRALRGTVPPENQIQSDGELAELRCEEMFTRAGVNIERYPNTQGAEWLNVLRSPRLQSELLGALQAASAAHLLWDKVHRGPDPERWLSPVYRRTVRDWVMMDPTVFLGGRVRFISKIDYLPYAGVDMAVYNIAVSDPALLIEWAWQRRDSPAISSDILVQTLVLYAYPAASVESLRFKPKLKAKLRDMTTSKNPTFRLMALCLIDSFKSDANELISICERAATEMNQVFWKVALLKLAAIGGPAAAEAAKSFRLSDEIPSDGTAFPDDAAVTREVERLISAVEARRNR